MNATEIKVADQSQMIAVLSALDPFQGEFTATPSLISMLVSLAGPAFALALPVLALISHV